MADKKEAFKPYIPADKVTPEFTVTSVVIGIILAIVFGAANAYLGLRVGLTISASIPAAVISMGVIRVLMKKNSILESNMVQTIGSAGESLAAGSIFTMPVLFLWAKEGVTDQPSLLTITLIALFGGLLGVFFMVPLRNALIVKEHGILPYPEVTACSEVLLAGESGGSEAKIVFLGMGAAALFKFIVDGLKVVGSTLTAPLRFIKTQFSVSVYPALVSVGYICGPKISSYMFAGGLLGWFVLIPAIVVFGQNTTLYPGTVTIGEMYAADGAPAIWSAYIRYIGAGMVAVGGLISLIKSMPLIVKTFKEAIKGVKQGGSDNGLRTSSELSLKTILLGIGAITVAMWLLPQVPVSILGAVMVIIFGFFFGTVSSRMVGLIGSSNNPVSGMTIATLLISAFILKMTSGSNAGSMVSAISIGSIICIIAAMAGDTSQDLKTGYILGATPKKQQIGEIIGAIVSAVAIGGVLILLNNAWGFGTPELSAPQASLMKMIVEGVMSGNLPWSLIGIGAFLAVVMEILHIPVLPVAIGLYLPLELSSPIMAGGLIRLIIDKRKKKASSDASAGVLFCSGMIAGEGIVGILLAVLAVIQVGGSSLSDKIDFSGSINTGWIGSSVLLLMILFSVYKAAASKNADPVAAAKEESSDKNEKK